MTQKLLFIYCAVESSSPSSVQCVVPPAPVFSPRFLISILGSHTDAAALQNLLEIEVGHKRISQHSWELSTEKVGCYKGKIMLSRKLKTEQKVLILAFFSGGLACLLLFFSCFSNKSLSICAYVFTNCLWIVIWLVLFCALIVKDEHFMEAYFSLWATLRIQLSCNSQCVTGQ